MVNDLRPRIGVENRIPEFIEEALRCRSLLARFAGGVAANLSDREQSTWQTDSSAVCGATSATA